MKSKFAPKKREDWHPDYHSFMFGYEVPLYKEKGTQLSNSLYKIGDPVYIKDENSIGFVINGPIPVDPYYEWASEVRTDTDGCQCVTTLEPFTKAHLEIKGVWNPYRDNPEIMNYLNSL